MVRLRPARRPRLGTLLALAGGVVVVAVGLTVLGVGPLGARSVTHSPPPMAKPFSLSQLGDPGKQLSLSAYAGKPVVINFFASWCAPCQRETPLLASFYRAHRGKVLVIGIDANDQSGHAQTFVRQHGVTYPIAFDPKAATTVAYGVAALPQTVFLNARHQIVRHVVGALTAAELNSWAASLAH